jgi:IS1 family transposase
MDETPHKAGRKGKGKLNSVWYWPIYGDDDEVCFTYSASRGRQHVDTLLKDFAGTLLTDGYAAYERFTTNRPEVTHAQCWSHTRRTFERAEQAEPQAVAQAVVSHIRPRHFFHFMSTWSRGIFPNYWSCRKNVKKATDSDEIRWGDRTIGASYAVHRRGKPVNG